MIIIISIFGLIMRSESIRKIIIKILPITILSNFYLVFQYFSQHTLLGNNIFIFIISILFILMEVVIFFLYISNFMKTFFNLPHRKPKHLNIES